MVNFTEDSSPICFIGAGGMGSAIRKPLTDKGIATVSLVKDLSKHRKNHRKICQFFNDPQKLPKTQVLIYAAKPNMVAEILPNVTQSVQEGGVLISVAAGVPVASFQKYCPANIHVVRSMPNTLLTIGNGVTGVYLSEKQQHLKAVIDAAFANQQSEVVYLENESDLNLVTSISGSGPAYFFLIAELLATSSRSELAIFKMMATALDGEKLADISPKDYQGGLVEITQKLALDADSKIVDFLLSFAHYLYIKAVDIGLSANQAKILVTMTMNGSAIYGQKFAKEKNAAQLRSEVTSPNGTTQKAVEALQTQEGSLKDVVFSAVDAAKNRAVEISKLF